MERADFQITLVWQTPFCCGRPLSHSISCPEAASDLSPAVKRGVNQAEITRLSAPDNEGKMALQRPVRKRLAAISGKPALR